MRLDLSEDERQELVGLVREAYKDINPEIHHATNLEYRENLKRRKVALQALLERLEATVDLKP